MRRMPRRRKSLMVTVALPAFVLGHEPHRRIFAISYGDDLANKHSSELEPMRPVLSGVADPALRAVLQDFRASG